MHCELCIMNYKCHRHRLYGADPMLIAYAMEHGGILVTDEKLNPAAHKKIYLPSVAEHFKIKCTVIFDVLRQLKAKFVLE